MHGRIVQYKLRWDLNYEDTVAKCNETWTKCPPSSWHPLIVQMQSKLDISLIGRYLHICIPTDWFQTYYTCPTRSRGQKA